MEFLLSLLMALLVTALAYLLIPIIFCITSKKFTESQIKKITIINGVVVWLIFAIIRINAGIERTSFAVFLWSAIAYWLMQKRCLLVQDTEHKATNDLKFTVQEQSTSYQTIGAKNIRSKKRANWFIVVLVILLIASLAFNIVQYNSHKDDNQWIEYDSYYVGVRIITFSTEQEALSFYNMWKSGDATEESMTDLMNQYGAWQDAGKLQFVEPGDFVEEIDGWCFYRGRKIGDVAIIENIYGFTLCYISSIVER